MIWAKVWLNIDLTSQHMRYWHLLHRRPAKAETRQRICEVSSELSLLAYTMHGCRFRLLPNHKSLTLMDCRLCTLRNLYCAYEFSTLFSCAGANVLLMPASWTNANKIQCHLPLPATLENIFPFRGVNNYFYSAWPRCVYVSGKEIEYL